MLPPQRHRAVPWNGLQVLALVILVMWFCPTLAQLVLQATSLLQQLYGGDFSEMLKRNETYAVARYQVWIAVVAFPLQLAMIILFSLSTGARPYQIGWTGFHFGRDVLVAIVSTVAITPLAQSVNLAIGELWRRYVTEPTPHFLTKISETQPQLIDWLLIFLSAVVVAAILEELLFRALLLSWALTRPHGGDITMAGVVLLSAVLVIRPVSHAASLHEAAIAASPLFFTLVMGLVYLVLRRAFRSAAVNGIFATGLLFGVVHFAAWPTPVALSLLGIGLGMLYYRMQSILPCVVTHALFNAVSYVELVIQASRHAKGQ